MHRGKSLRLFCMILCGASAVGYGVTTANVDAHSFRREPVISMEESSICLNVSDGETEILSGVTAQDAEDGDVTESLTIESVSSFFPDRSREATIAAFDSDGNVSRVVRKITYRDYTSPRIYLKAPLELKTTDTTQLREFLQAKDCLDGDLSDEIRIVSEDGMRPDSGSYRVHLQVTNSAGDTTDIPVSVTFYDYDARQGNARLLLSDYLIYVKKGEQPDWKQYLKGLIRNGKEQDWNSEDSPEIDKNSIQIHDPADTDTPGVYETEYSLDSNGYIGNVRLVVVVEE